MMTRLAVVSLALVAFSSPVVHADDAKATAQAFLDKGSALYDARDVAGLVATYLDDAEIFWIDKDGSTGEVKQNIKHGRGEVEELYRDLFKDENAPKTTSKNTVDFARLVAPDLIVVQGTFQPDTAKTEKYPFIQVRVKQGDRWMMKTLQLFVIAQGD